MRDRVAEILRRTALIGVIAGGVVIFGTHAPALAAPSTAFAFCSVFPEACHDWAGGACDGGCNAQSDACCWPSQD